VTKPTQIGINKIMLAKYRNFSNTTPDKKVAKTIMNKLLASIIFIDENPNV